MDKSNAKPQTECEKSASGGEKKLKACCACPETKQVRDKCIIENGEEGCLNEIKAHRECMIKMGFNV